MVLYEEKNIDTLVWTLYIDDRIFCAARGDVGSERQSDSTDVWLGRRDSPRCLVSKGFRFTSSLEYVNRENMHRITFFEIRTLQRSTSTRRLTASWRRTCNYTTPLPPYPNYPLLRPIDPTRPSEDYTQSP